MRYFVRCSLAGILVSVFVTVASAGPLWVIENQSDQVFTVDVNTQTATLVGSTGINYVFGGLGFAQDGTLYAWSTGGAGGNLYTVDLGTGNFTLIGGSGLFGADTFDINPATNEAIAWSVSGSLNDVDLGTGSTTFRSNTSPTEAGIASAFGPDGTLYHLDRDSDVLNTVDIDSGIVSLVGPLGVNANATNLAFNPDDGFLYFIQIFDSNYPLYRVDPLTGAATLVGNVSGFPNNPSQQVTAGTFQISAPVPEPASLAMWTLLGLAGSGYGLRRRRRQLKQGL